MVRRKRSTKLIARYKESRLKAATFAYLMIAELNWMGSKKEEEGRKERKVGWGD